MTIIFHPWPSRRSALRAAVVLSAVLCAGNTTWASLVRKTVTYHSAGKPYEGYVVYDDDQKNQRPGILVVHDWMGLTEKTKKRAEEVARLGYVAFAVDIYGKGIRPQSSDEASKLAALYKKDRVLLRTRMQEGLRSLRKQATVDRNKIAAIGYCFGGTAAIELARAGADIDGVVSFHGGLDSPRPEDGKNIKGRILALHGADDPYVSAPDLAAFEAEMRKHKIDWQLVKYGNAVHSFTDESAGNDPTQGAAYDPKADRRSWVDMQEFLKSVF